MDLELDELKREFLVEARDKVLEIESSIAAERTPDVLKRIKYLAHQLKGSGGSYGYQQISIDATELEKTIEQSEGGSSDQEIQPHLSRHVASLKAEVEKGIQALAPS